MCMFFMASAISAFLNFLSYFPVLLLKNSPKFITYPFLNSSEIYILYLITLQCHLIEKNLNVSCPQISRKSLVLFVFPHFLSRDQVLKTFLAYTRLKNQSFLYHFKLHFWSFHQRIRQGFRSLSFRKEQEFYPMMTPNCSKTKSLFAIMKTIIISSFLI